MLAFEEECQFSQSKVAAFEAPRTNGRGFGLEEDTCVLFWARPRWRSLQQHYLHRQPRLKRNRRFAASRAKNMS